MDQWFDGDGIPGVLADLPEENLGARIRQQPAPAGTDHDDSTEILPSSNTDP